INFMGFQIPSVWFQSVYSLFIIILAPVFSLLWPMLARNNMNLSSMSKFVIGILFASGGFTVMMYASESVLATGSGVSP
ncbi:POT-type proton-dependent oligopeptide transporter, partial [Proteus mirabilis]|uniref:POT-type proton-dependent oligopeptide transporter n=1 Tax=Proteus mirabilis TaxID=584 RepID=UPI0025814D35|nr:MFS transporter [Proteus mirabilis]